jgi:hypothetical protein
MAFKFPTADTAFAVGSTRGRKRPRVENGSHLAFIRTLPCVACGRHDGVQAAHIRFENPLAGKRECGKGEKPDDAFTTPLCEACHAEQHKGSERAFWARLGIDPHLLALALHHCTGDAEMAEAIIYSHRRWSK